LFSGRMGDVVFLGYRCVLRLEFLYGCFIGDVVCSLRRWDSSKCEKNVLEDCSIVFSVSDHIRDEFDVGHVIYCLA
jgi:hypothetical protein